jgi:pimeloyl-ACP methyl ester carboxylesterase
VSLCVFQRRHLLQGMKIRSDREALPHLTAFPKLLILGEKDPVLPHEETKQQVENTEVELIVFQTDIYPYIENEEELTGVLLKFFKHI